MDSLIIYPDGTDKPGLSIPIANGFVGRVVSAVSDVNIPDAQRVAEILNRRAAPVAEVVKALEQEAR